MAAERVIASQVLQGGKDRLGDRVEIDEALFEISTEKVDAEIPSPAAGTLSEIRVTDGQTVGVNTVLAVIRSALG